mgnify:CR=1 FL=1
MENFTFYAPTYFAFGKDTENDKIKEKVNSSQPAR